MPAERRPQRLARLTLTEAELPFTFSFKHAAAERRAAHTLFVAVTTEAGVTGYGEVAPRPYLTGETVASAIDAIAGDWWRRVRGVELGGADTAPFMGLAALHAEADAARRTAAWAGLDVAMHDAWARACGRPLGSLLQGLRSAGDGDEQARTTAGAAAQPLTGIVGMGMPPALVARLYRFAGCRDVKIKVGDPAGLERVRAVRRAVGPEVELRADANGAWDLDAARREVPALVAAGAEIIEEPLRGGRDAIEGMAALQAETGAALMADESLCTLDDARRLVAAGAARCWNLRLAKCGGFSGVRAMLAVAKEHGIRCQLGQLVGESAVLRAAGRAAAVWPGFAWIEALGSGWLLRHEPFSGGPSRFERHARPLQAAAGLGVQPRRALERLAVRTIELD
jgi:muconate cycloisomerase